MDEIVKTFIEDIYEVDAKHPGFHYIERFLVSLICNDSPDFFGTKGYAFMRRYGEMNNGQKVLILQKLLKNFSQSVQEKILALN